MTICTSVIDAIADRRLRILAQINEPKPISMSQIAVYRAAIRPRRPSNQRPTPCAQKR